MVVEKKSVAGSIGCATRSAIIAFLAPTSKDSLALIETCHSSIARWSHFIPYSDAIVLISALSIRTLNRHHPSQFHLLFLSFSLPPGPLSLHTRHSPNPKTPIDMVDKGPRVDSTHRSVDPIFLLFISFGIILVSFLLGCWWFIIRYSHRMQLAV